MKSICTLLLALTLLLTACSTGSHTSDPSTAETTSPTEAVTLSPSEQFSDRDQSTDTEGCVDILLEGSSANCTDKGVSVNADTVTIVSPGKYRLKGKLAGTIVVDVAKTDHVQLILDNARITGTNTAAIFVKQAEKVVLTLEGENILQSEGTFPETEDSTIDAAVFAKDDLSFNGTGSLTVASPGHGIVCKDDLVFSGGTYKVDAVRHALSTKDSIRIGDGTFTLNAGKDCINTENTEDPAASYIYIVGGTFDLTAEGDGISGDSTLQIDGGSFNITSGGGSQNGAPHYGDRGGFPGSSGSSTATEDTISTKGIKAAGDVLIYGGTFQINSADDSIHSNGSVQLHGGTLLIESGDDGIHAEEQLLVRAGEITVSSSYEGLEAHRIDIEGGTMDITASDDGLNAAGGNDGSGMGRNDMFAVDENAYISISGGKLWVNASGDGIDSNGALRVSGGETFVSGPTNNGNGALDCNGQPTISGGIFVAAGASGMAMGFGTGSTQGAIFVSYNTQEAGSKVSLTNAAGEELLSWETTKSSSSIILSCPDIVKGETYTLTVGSITGEITMTDILYGTSNGMGGPGGGGPGGRPGGHGGR